VSNEYSIYNIPFLFSFIEIQEYNQFSLVIYQTEVYGFMFIKNGHFVIGFYTIQTII